MLFTSMGKKFGKTKLSVSHMGCVRFARYCGQFTPTVFFLAEDYDGYLYLEAAWKSGQSTGLKIWRSRVQIHSDH